MPELEGLRFGLGGMGYMRLMLQTLQDIDALAQAVRAEFERLFYELIVQPVTQHPELLLREYWDEGF